MSATEQVREDDRPRGAITVLGSVNMDLVATTTRLPAPGETVLGSGFSTVCGGKGSNQAIAASRASGGSTTVRFLGAVGEDAFGGELRANLAAAGVHVDLVRTAPGPSGIAVILVDEAAENVIVVVAGANGTLTRLTAAEEEDLAESELVICQLEIPVDTVAHAAQIVGAAGKTFLLNPSPVQKLPEALLASTSILVLNEGEAATLGGSALDRVPHVVTTLGSAGARYRGADGAVFDVPAPKVDAVDTTGAGDAFTGAFAVAWSEQRSAKDAVRWACAAGALATTVPGAGTSAPGRAAIDQLVAATYRD
jgi:ribokinase